MSTWPKGFAWKKGDGSVFSFKMLGEINYHLTESKWTKSQSVNEGDQRWDQWLEIKMEMWSQQPGLWIRPKLSSRAPWGRRATEGSPSLGAICVSGPDFSPQNKCAKQHNHHEAIPASPAIHQMWSFQDHRQPSERDSLGACSPSDTTPGHVSRTPGAHLPWPATDASTGALRRECVLDSTHGLTITRCSSPELPQKSTKD